MRNRDNLIDTIIAREWEFFQEVNNVGGPASCQSMPRTFSTMRRAQYTCWDRQALESWLDDLADYRARGMNPVTIKYARMMESTHPDEFASLATMLPPVPNETHEAVEELVGLTVRWADELAQHYPLYMGRGRVLHTRDDTPDKTSVETYARGEMSTYSLRTLTSLLATYRTAAQEGRNLQELIAVAQVHAYGYQSLDDVERVLATGSMGDRGLDGQHVL
ncbi:DUF4125 family protein [Collinsella sp. An271]|uniref:DUF4125 family protein n=1 Tax=Collinsella sp. An271 TaxID=1965616 RepID=UPI0013028A0C|nr:DUF4125 family protein [Collinsella sp. An271]